VGVGGEHFTGHWACILSICPADSKAKNNSHWLSLALDNLSDSCGDLLLRGDRWFCTALKNGGS
jgi:hypothetical protein